MYIFSLFLEIFLDVPKNFLNIIGKFFNEIVHFKILSLLKLTRSVGVTDLGLSLLNKGIQKMSMMKVFLLIQNSLKKGFEINYFLFILVQHSIEIDFNDFT